jgi:hypothetical protein
MIMETIVIHPENEAQQKALQITHHQPKVFFTLVIAQLILCQKNYHCYLWG